MENMAGEARANLEDAYYLIHDYQEKKFQFVLHREDIIDKYEDKLGSYLIQLTGKELTPQQNKTVTKYLHAIGDLERIGDHAMNIAECAKEIEEKGIVFSHEADRELSTLFPPSRRSPTTPSPPSPPGTWPWPTGWSLWRRSSMPCATR